MASITPVPHVRLLACDWANTVTGRTTAEGTTTFAHTPFGHRSPETDEDDGAGFNGQHQERHGGYLLGHGYREYRPTLGRFNAPDSYSPFGSGGLNCYAYCRGEPVNRSDPSGHRDHGTKDGDLFSWLNIGVGVLMASAGVGLLAKGIAKNLGLGLAVGGGLQAGLGTAALAPDDRGTKDAMNIGAALLGFGGLLGGFGIGRMMSRSSNQVPVSRGLWRTSMAHPSPSASNSPAGSQRINGSPMASVSSPGGSPITAPGSRFTSRLYLERLSFDGVKTSTGAIVRSRVISTSSFPPLLPTDSMPVQSAINWPVSSAGVAKSINKPLTPDNDSESVLWNPLTNKTLNIRKGVWK